MNDIDPQELTAARYSHKAHEWWTAALREDAEDGAINAPTLMRLLTEAAQRCTRCTPDA